jgi:hypothetical protein
VPILATPTAFLLPSLEPLGQPEPLPMGGRVNPSRSLCFLREHRASFAVYINALDVVVSPPASAEFCDSRSVLVEVLMEAMVLTTSLAK